ncbi:MAG: class F sortase [Candidatus Levyibacteriota bacterium]
MKLYSFFAFLFFLGLAIVFPIHTDPGFKSKALPFKTTMEPRKAVFYPPTTLFIPKINLSANVVPVGLDNENRMDVPNNFVDVGWYSLGSKPGELGSVVLDGHFDDFHGGPAVFYRLNELQNGDQILITDSSGKKLVYTVSKNLVYPLDSMPLENIFHASDKFRLNIITCHGSWDNTLQTYNQRTVIYAQLQSS